MRYHFSISGLAAPAMKTSGAHKVMTTIAAWADAGSFLKKFMQGKAGLVSGGCGGFGALDVLHRGFQALLLDAVEIEVAHENREQQAQQGSQQDQRAIARGCDEIALVGEVIGL